MEGNWSTIDPVGRGFGTAPDAADGGGQVAERFRAVLRHDNVFERCRVGGGPRRQAPGTGWPRSRGRANALTWAPWGGSGGQLCLGVVLRGSTELVAGGTFSAPPSASAPGHQAPPKSRYSVTKRRPALGGPAALAPRRKNSLELRQILTANPAAVIAAFGRLRCVPEGGAFCCRGSRKGSIGRCVLSRGPLRCGGSRRRFHIMLLVDFMQKAVQLDVAPRWRHLRPSIVGIGTGGADVPHQNPSLPRRRGSRPQRAPPRLRPRRPCWASAERRPRSAQHVGPPASRSGDGRAMRGSSGRASRDGGRRSWGPKWPCVSPRRGHPTV